MKVTRSGSETGPAPSEFFTGSVTMTPVANPSERSRINATSVHFEPSARTAWHTHPNGQTLFVTEGIGLAQGRGGPIEVIRPGDRVWIDGGEDHWHGASAALAMTHLSFVEVDDDGNAAVWGDQVTGEEYAAAPPVD